jgi:Icc-related predicted phosphoesterase
MRLVLMSDTHGLHASIPEMPPGDVLVHAGDISLRGSLPEIADFLAWFEAQPHRWKLLVAGNHDFAFERQAELTERMVPSNVVYLRDSGIVIEGVRFWGSPWQPWFYDWAFNLLRGPEIAAKWALIPEDVQVLITHGPPHGILDAVERPRGKHAGCEALRDRIGALPALRLHAFGHIHEAYGQVEQDARRYVNACICDFNYAPVNAPVVVDFD